MCTTAPLHVSRGSALRLQSWHRWSIVCLPSNHDELTEETLCVYRPGLLIYRVSTVSLGYIFTEEALCIYSCSPVYLVCC
jgi:hypothetical protein